MVIRTAAQNLFIIQKYAFYEYTGKSVQATAIEANGKGRNLRQSQRKPGHQNYLQVSELKTISIKMPDDPYKTVTMKNRRRGVDVFIYRNQNGGEHTGNNASKYTDSPLSLTITNRQIVFGVTDH